MGVKGLWTVLGPFCDRKPLYELQGKTVAVDLSCWICEAQNITEYQVQPRMYLRNLYFRTCYLLLMDVNPVFVLEGKAPELKYDTILARNAVQFKGAKPKSNTVKTGKDRTRFHFVLRQCEEMLRYMGLACIKGNGEAESLCAYLNEDGLVDGCISQDSDCFAYGAQVVYRNFSISTQGAQAASGGAVDVYDIRKANHSLNFGRNKIIAMALLIGCDYSEGVHGVGKDSVLKFFETVSEDEVLDRLRSWRKNNNLYENYEKRLADKSICPSCGHNGKIQGHTKAGCVDCKTSKGCNPFKYKEERLNIKNEVNMRNKAIQADPNFPDEILIKEFLNRKDNVKELDLKWMQPDVVKFMKFTTKFLQWEELYTFEKILPILTRWQCRNPDLVHKNQDKLKGVLKPDRIKKVRNPKGVPSYEIIWSDPGECFKGLIPESQISENNVDLDKLWSTIEPQNLVEVAYSQLVEDFRQSKVKAKKVVKRKKNKHDNTNEIADKLRNVSIAEPKLKKSRKPKAVAGQTSAIKTSEMQLKTVKNSKTIEQVPVEFDANDLNSSFKQMTIEKRRKATSVKIGNLDGFLKKAMTNSYKQKTSEICCLANGKNTQHDHLPSLTSSSTPVKANVNVSFDFNASSFGDESDLELSEIIDEIISRKDLKHNLKCVADKYVQCLKESTEVSLDDTGESDGLVYPHIGSSDEYNDLNTHKENPYKNDIDEYIAHRCTMENNEPECESDDNDLKEDGNHVSSFFVSNLKDGQDLFEETFNKTFRNFKDSSGSNTEEYEYEINCLIGEKENKEKNIGNKINRGPNRKLDNNVSEKDDADVLYLSSDDSSFSDNYVPLYERLKCK